MPIRLVDKTPNPRSVWLDASWQTHVGRVNLAINRIGSVDRIVEKLRSILFGVALRPLAAFRLRNGVHLFGVQFGPRPQEAFNAPKTINLGQIRQGVVAFGLLLELHTTIGERADYCFGLPQLLEFVRESNLGH
jgi:hypothetical protein